MEALFRSGARALEQNADSLHGVKMNMCFAVFFTEPQCKIGNVSFSPRCAVFCFYTKLWWDNLLTH